MNLDTKIKRIPVLDSILILTIALTGRVGYWILKGTATGADTPTYTSTCDIWFTQPWLLPRIINAGFTIPFCLVTDLLGLSVDLWVALQIGLSTVTCVLVYAVASAHLDRIAGLVAGVSMAILWESFQWDIYILTDSIFVSVVTVALWAVSRHYRYRTRQTYWIAWASLALVFFTRAHGFPIVAGWLLLDFLPQGHRYRLNLIPNPMYGIAIAILGTGILLTQYFGFLTDTIFQWYGEGLLVWDSSMFQYPYELSQHASPIAFVVFNIHHIILITLLRFVLIFVPILPRWSTVHNAANVGTLVPIILSGGYGFITMLRSKSNLFRLWAIPLVMLLLTISLTHVDWDWRYRAPAAPMFSLLTGYAGWRLWHSERVQSIKQLL